MGRRGQCLGREPAGKGDIGAGAGVGEGHDAGTVDDLHRLVEGGTTAVHNRQTGQCLDGAESARSVNGAYGAGIKRESAVVGHRIIGIHRAKGDVRPGGSSTLIRAVERHVGGQDHRIVESNSSIGNNITAEFGDAHRVGGQPGQARRAAHYAAKRGRPTRVHCQGLGPVHRLDEGNVPRTGARQGGRRHQDYIAIVSLKSAGGKSAGQGGGSTVINDISGQRRAAGTGI